MLGTEGGAYYAGADLTREALDGVREAITQDPLRPGDEIVAVSEQGRAPRNDPAILALAPVASVASPEGTADPLERLERVCRTGAHLLRFARLVELHRGWGRSLARAVGAWYRRPVDAVAHHAVKYRQRDGWTHRDLLRLAHPQPPTPEHAALYAPPRRPSRKRGPTA